MLMMCVRRFGVVGIVVVALSAICRPASAEELMFSFTAAQLENAIDSDASFGDGACAGPSPDKFSTMCGVFEITATPNLSAGAAAETSLAWIGTPSSTGSAAWESALLQYDPETYASVPVGVDFWGDFEDYGSTDPYVSFVTGNSHTNLTNYDVLPSTFATVAGAPPLAANTVFSFELTTSDPTTVADNGSNVTWNFKIDTLPLNADGTANNNVALKTFWDDSVTDFKMGVVVTPEPATGLLCWIGLAAWGIRRRRRPVSEPRVID